MTEMDSKTSAIDPKVLAAMDACIVHARALLESAQAVFAKEHANIAYHLATLCLEEIGRRALIGVQSISDKEIIPPAWPKKHEQDHIKKLFWCFFDAKFLGDKLTADGLREMTGLAERIHENRLAGLYVGNEADGLSIPSEAIDRGQAKNLIGLAEARLGMAEASSLREEAPQEDIDLQKWFLTAADDPEHRKQIFSGKSMEKLAELRDARAWARWLKDLFEKAQAASQDAVAREIERSRNAPKEKTQDKWKVRVRILCASHSIRPKVLSTWNKKSDWIKLTSVSGKKNELLIDFVLGDNIPVGALWYFAWGVARQFVVALNIGSMGFWWWRMPQDVSRYYEYVHDLENGAEIGLERSPSLKIDWGENRVLTIEDLGRTAAVFASLPSRDASGQPTGLDMYIGGLTFLALNDVHWQCEVQSFGNFFESLRLMMAQNDHWKPGEPFEPSFLRFIDELFPTFDEKERYAELVRAFDSQSLADVKVTLKEVSFIKLFCDAYFLKHMPRAKSEAAERV